MKGSKAVILKIDRQKENEVLRPSVISKSRGLTVETVRKAKEGMNAFLVTFRLVENSPLRSKSMTNNLSLSRMFSSISGVEKSSRERFWWNEGVVV